MAVELIEVFVVREGKTGNYSWAYGMHPIQY